MKLTPLWNDPVGWSEQVARTKRRIFLWALIHLGFVTIGLCAIYWAIGALGALTEAPWGRLLAIVIGAGPILVIGVGYPVMYLYAMHRLLDMIKGRDSAETQGSD